ncbi:MAG TPA: hypothetical protein PLZ43_13750 [bacterium]|nr:hypothetical protein [bacterium]
MKERNAGSAVKAMLNVFVFFHLQATTAKNVLKDIIMTTVFAKKAVAQVLNAPNMRGAILQLMGPLNVFVKVNIRILMIVPFVWLDTAGMKQVITTTANIR